jgi:antitoxin Phd
MAIKRPTVKCYSIAEARNQFTRMVHVAETGVTVELTRRGKPIAVLLAIDDYQRLSEARRGFVPLFQSFLERNPDLVELSVEPAEWLQNVRDLSPGPDFHW